MIINIKGRNIEINSDLHNFINKKIQKLIKDFRYPVECNVVLLKERNKIFTEIILSGDHGKFYFKKSADDVYSSVEQTINAADLNIKKFKEKQKEKRKRFKYEFKTIPQKEKTIIIDYTKKELKPASYKEAYLQLEYLKQRFIIFTDVKNEKPAVLYRVNDKIILIRKISKIKKIFGFKKYGIESFFASYKNDKLYLKRNKDLKIDEVENLQDAIRNLNERNKYVIAKLKDSEKFYFFIWIRPNKIGRFAL
jgi:ribosomal subunit interface protein